MEIADYLGIARRYLAVLIVVPLLAAGLAVAYVVLTPRPYTATAYVSLPYLPGSTASTYDGPRGVDQFVSDLTATATSPGVATAVTSQTAASADDVMNGIAVTQVDLSSRVQLTYTTTHPEEAGPVVTAVAAQSLRSMFGPQAHLAQARVRAAAGALHHANQDLARFSRKYGALPVDERYTALTGEITKLREQKALDESNGDWYGASVLQDTIAEKQAKAAGLAPALAHYQDLVAQKKAAQNSLTLSHQTLAEAEAQLAAADPNQAIHATPPVMTPLVSLLLTRALPALATGLFLAVGLVAVLELLARRRPAEAGATSTVSSTDVRHIPAEGHI